MADACNGGGHDLASRLALRQRERRRDAALRARRPGRGARELPHRGATRRRLLHHRGRHAARGGATALAARPPSLHPSTDTGAWGAVLAPRGAQSGAQIEAQERGVLAISSGMLCEGGLSAPQGAAVVLGGSTPKTFTTP
eukprot:scaffold2449_cov340-Prasinococcus_capsulatus_cf.AAC.9